MLLSLIQLAFQFRYVKNLWNSIVDYFNQIRGLFGSFKLIDLVDILFVTLVIYIIVRIIRDTRAMQLIKGLIIFAALYFVVSFLGMGASSYILRSIFSNIILIIVMLFAPELRNILEHMGKGAMRKTVLSLLTKGSAVELYEINETIDAAVKACADMSDSKTGALIVFERDTMLGDIIASGTSIDAKPTREMIENIFFPKAPMHDGAMILRNARICAAGCILPLSRDNNISSSLGTRHRAAIGLSQQSDAIVTVVSEETGNISVAINGSLQQNITPLELRILLNENLVPDSGNGDETLISRLKRRFKK